MMTGRRGFALSADDVRLIMALVSLGVVLSIQYHDEIALWRTRAEAWLNRSRNAEAEALRQVQKEISLMEHGEVATDG